MSYLIQSDMAQDSNLLRRITACAAVEGMEDHQSWASRNIWSIVTTPGWVDAYRGATKPAGSDESAITDEMILDAVSKLRPVPEEGWNNAN